MAHRCNDCGSYSVDTNALTERELQAVNDELASLVEKVYATLREAEALARKHKLEFYFRPDGYGTYDGAEGSYGWSASSC